MTYSMEGLKQAAKCIRKRETKIPRYNKEINEVEISKFAVELLKNILFNGLAMEDAERQVEAFYQSLDFPSEKTRLCKQNDLMYCIKRYVHCEERPLMQGMATTANIHGLDVYFNPDAIFYDGSTLEIIKYMYKKPDVTQNGHKTDHCVKSNMLLYCMLWYGEHMVPAGQSVRVKASIYFLKKADDKFSKGEYNNNFFDLKDGKNIVTMDTSYIGGQTPNSYWDHIYAPMFQPYINGQQMAYDKEHCKYCELKNVCAYEKSPQPVPMNKTVADIRQIPYTKAQIEAINFMEGVSRINAGAGAGKTLTIALRAVNLLLKGILPESICLLTFTDTGAREMRERIQIYCEQMNIGTEISRMTISTFNSFGNDLVAANYKKLGYKRPPRLIDEVEKASVVAELLRDTDVPGLDYRNFDSTMVHMKGALPMAKKILEIIKTYQLQKNNESIQFILAKLKKEGHEMEEETIDKMFDLYQTYNELLFKHCLIEYADQELLLFELYKQNDKFFEDLKFKHIILDEFQDSNKRQMDLVRLLTETKYFKSLMVVGDDSQAIYGFRDTSPEFIINFYDYLGKQGVDYFLLQNHRSTPEIIHFANCINSKNKKKVAKSLVSTKKSGKPVMVSGFFNRDSEYAYIRNLIRQKHNAGIAYEDMAFIAAKRSELIAMQDILNAEGIPTVLINPEPLMENSRILAALELIRFLEDPEYIQGITSYLNCSLQNKLFDNTTDVIKSSINKFVVFATQFQSFSNEEKGRYALYLLKQLEDNDEIYAKFYNLLESKETFDEILKYCLDFLRFGSTNAIKRELHYNGVALTTAHSSKGLEWKVVFNSISHYDSEELHDEDHEDELEEKRRLFFVSITRAKEELYITGKFIGYGSFSDQNYNMFLREAYEIQGLNIEEVAKNKKKAS